MKNHRLGIRRLCHAYFKFNHLQDAPYFSRRVVSRVASIREPQRAFANPGHEGVRSDVHGCRAAAPKPPLTRRSPACPGDAAPEISHRLIDWSAVLSSASLILHSQRSLHGEAPSSRRSFSPQSGLCFLRPWTSPQRRRLTRAWRRLAAGLRMVGSYSLELHSSSRRACLSPVCTAAPEYAHL